MNKMEQILGASGIELLRRRGKKVATLIAMEQETLINLLRRDVLSLESKMEEILDVSVKSRDSLSPTNENFDPKRFVEEIQGIKKLLRNKRIELKFAEATYKSLFVADASSVSMETLNNTDVDEDLEDSEDPLASSEDSSKTE